MSLKILFEDPYILVIDKEAGLTVNRSDTTGGEETVQDMVGELVEKEGSEEFLDRGGVVHRLDKETSGALIIARDSDSFSKLQEQFKERTVEKEYIALAHGKLRPEKGEIVATVGRLPWNRKRFGVLAGGREAQTFYETLETIDYDGQTLSLVRLLPKTGRTHQIRVHLKHIGNPIFSDFLYAGRKTSRNDRKILGRVFLHARRIRFHHPKSGEEMDVVAPLPKDLITTLNLLKFKAGGDL